MITKIISGFQPGNATTTAQSVLDVFSPALLIVAFGLLLLLPSAAVFVTFLRQRKRDDAAAVSPFSELRRRPAGESLRVRLQKLDEEIDEWLLVLVITPIVSAVALTYDRARSSVSITLFFLAATALAAFVQSRLKPLMRERRNCHLGFQGERYVAEELNQLLANGYDVFHDAPFNNYNIDHVVIGPTGVFIIETKTKRKPVHESEKQYEVTFDGTALQFPHGRDTDGLDQLDRNVKSFSRWVASATGDRIAVTEILTIRGWFVKRDKRYKNRVLNPKEIGGVIASYGGTPLDRGRIQRARYQLEEKCKVAL